MALSMPRPYMHKGGVYYLNVRLASDVAFKLKGHKLSLPIGDSLIETKVTDKVFLSLRTKDTTVAKSRFTAAFASLTRQLDAVRAGPKPLLHKQIVALAGDIYRARVRRDENDPNLGPEHLQQRLAEWTAAIVDIR